MSRYGVCTTALRTGSFVEDVEMAARIRAVGLAMTCDEVKDLPAEHVRQILDSAGLVPSTMMTGCICRGANDLASNCKEVERVLDHAAAIGVSGVSVLSGPLAGLSRREADSRTRSWFDRMVSLANDRGIVLMLEALHPLLSSLSHVHSLRHAAGLVGDYSSTGIVVDVAHIWWDHHFLDDLAQLGSRIGAVQIADIDGSALAKGKYERVQLGTGIIPFDKILPAIRQTGFAGVVENEVRARIPRTERTEFFRAGREWFNRAWSA